jgi:hypothetical protein
MCIRNSYSIYLTYDHDCVSVHNYDVADIKWAESVAVLMLKIIFKSKMLAIS